MGVTACGSQIPVLGTCPADDEQLLFFNVSALSGGIRGMAIRTWGKVKECVAQSFFGPGSIVITGADLDGSGQYFNSSLIDNLLVFACNIPNYLQGTSQWDYIMSGSDVVGVQILIGYDPTDIFIISPNPNPSIV